MCELFPPVSAGGFFCFCTMLPPLPVIRRANTTDLAALQALATACNVCQPDAHDAIWLAESADGEILGFIACILVLDEMSLLALAVAPAARRQGIARTLHQTVLDALRPTVAFLEVRAGNHGAQALYRSLGYRASGRRRAYYPNPDGSREDALVLRWQAMPA